MSAQGLESSFGQLLKAVYCPVCGSALSVTEVAGRKVLVCSRHGAMRAYLEQDPKAEVSRRGK